MMEINNYHSHLVCLLSMIFEIKVDSTYIYTHKMIIINEQKMKVINIIIAIDNNYGRFKC